MGHDLKVAAPLDGLPVLVRMRRIWRDAGLPPDLFRLDMTVVCYATIVAFARDAQRGGVLEAAPAEPERMLGLDFGQRADS